MPEIHNVEIEKLIPTQSGLLKEKVQALSPVDLDKLPPLKVERGSDGELFLLDGHSRAMNALSRGSTTIRIEYVDEGGVSSGLADMVRERLGKKGHINIQDLKLFDTAADMLDDMMQDYSARDLIDYLDVASSGSKKDSIMPVHSAPHTHETIQQPQVPSSPKEIPQDQLLDRIKEKAPGKYDFDNLSEEDRLWLTNVMDEKNEQGFREFLQRHEVSKQEVVPPAFPPEQLQPAATQPTEKQKTQPDPNEIVVWRGEEMTREEADKRDRIWRYQEQRDQARLEQQQERDRMASEQQSQREEELERKATPYSALDGARYLLRSGDWPQEEEELARKRWEKTSLTTKAVAVTGAAIVDQGPRAAKLVANTAAKIVYGTALGSKHLLDGGAKLVHDIRNDPVRKQAQEEREKTKAWQREQRELAQREEKKRFAEDWRNLERQMQDSGTGMTP